MFILSQIQVCNNCNKLNKILQSLQIVVALELKNYGGGGKTLIPQ